MTPFTSLPGPLSASPALAFTLVFVVALLVSVALRLWLPPGVPRPGPGDQGD